MITLLLVGGESRRFYDAGYTVPKAILPMPDGRVLLEHVIEGLGDSDLIICGRVADRRNITPYLNGRCRSVWSPAAPQGPLYGLLDAAELPMWDTETLVCYCDTLIQDNLPDMLADWRAGSGAESGAVVFRSTDPRFGYWRGGRVVEKQAVSPWALAGLFYFRRASTALARARKIARPGMGIPHLLNRQTRVHRAKPGEIVDLGVPAAYEDYVRAQRVAKSIHEMSHVGELVPA